MIHIHIDYGPHFDGEGRRLPPYVRCWASCDLCKKAGEVVYGDTSFDKGIARASAGLEHVFNSTCGNGRELCLECRTVRFEVDGKPDAMGRYSFAILWRDECMWDERGRVLPDYRRDPSVRTRGQHFFTDPKPYIESYRRRGFFVEITA